MLHDIDLDVYPGQIVRIHGNNGAGKTTLLHVIAGLHPATAGTITFDGQPINHLSAAQRNRRGIAILTQHRGLFPASPSPTT